MPKYLSELTLYLFQAVSNLVIVEKLFNIWSHFLGFNILSIITIINTKIITYNKNIFTYKIVITKLRS